MIAIDTNLLVYAHRKGTKEHRSSIRAIEQAVESGKGWGISFPVIGEFWSVVTHPACPPKPSPTGKAEAFLASLLSSANGEIWMPGPGFPERLLATASALGLSGPRIFDLQIAMIAFEGGATELWSHDTAFVSVPGLPVHDPL